MCLCVCVCVCVCVCACGRECVCVIESASTYGGAPFERVHLFVEPVVNEITLRARMGIVGGIRVDHRRCPKYNPNILNVQLIDQPLHVWKSFGVHAKVVEPRGPCRVDIDTADGNSTGSVIVQQ